MKDKNIMTTDDFFILEHLKNKTGILFNRYCMDIDTLVSNKKYWKKLEDNDKRKAQILLDNGKYMEEISYMLKNNCKLEQAIVSWIQYTLEC
jgi:hypothetical protein